MKEKWTDKILFGFKTIRTKGPVSLVRSAGNLAYRTVPFTRSGQPFQTRRSEQTQKKWELIAQNLSDSDASLLDIGCDAGHLTANAAERGILSIGVDRYEKFEGARERAHTLSKERTDLGFVNKGLTPGNMDSLPETDVVLLLSVYHYWYREFGREAAEEMLGSLSGSDKIFFSSTSLKRRYDPREFDEHSRKKPELPTFTDRDQKEVIQYHEDLLRSSLRGNYQIEYLGAIPYSSETRYMLLATLADS